MSSASPNTVPVNDPSRALPEHASPDAGKPKGSPLRLIIVTLIVLALAGGAAWLIHKNSAEMATTNQRQAASLDRSTPIQAATAMQKTMPIYLTALGSVTAYNTVTLRSRVDGQLLRVNFTEGQSVKQGDLLLQIDPSPYEAALAQAQGQLAKDQANAGNAHAEAQRYNSLYEANVVSREQRDLQVSTAGQADGLIKADEAAIQAAKVNLAYTRITSPINGVVGLRQIDPGNIVHASDSTGLIVITQIHPISIIFTIPEDQLPQVTALTRNGKKLTVEAWDRSNSTKIATGQLLTIDNQIDQTTGTVKLKSVFQNQDGSLFPNQFVNIRLILQDRPNSIVIPAAAIQTGTQGTFVFLLHKGPVPEALRQANAQGGGGGGRRGGGGNGGGGNNANGGGNGGNGGGGNAGGGGRGGNGGGAGGGRGGNGGGRGGNGQPYYVTTQTVKVGVTEGAQVIIDSGINVGDQVVIDGQEKRRKGSPVSLTSVVSGDDGGGVGDASSRALGGIGSGTNAGAGGGGQPGPGPNNHGHGGGQNGPGQAGQQTGGDMNDQSSGGHKRHRSSQSDNANGRNGNGGGTSQQ